MAQLLIRAFSTTNPNLEKQLSCCYQKGDPILVMEDGHVWGKEEKLPKFWIIQVDYAKKEELESFVVVDEKREVFSDKPSEMIRRRAFCFDMIRLTVDEKRKLTATGVLRLELKRLKEVMRDKRV